MQEQEHSFEQSENVGYKVCIDKKIIIINRQYTTYTTQTFKSKNTHKQYIKNIYLEHNYYNKLLLLVLCEVIIQ